MKKIIYTLFTLCTLFSISSCMKMGLEELPVHGDAFITSVSRVEYRYISDEISPASGQKIVKASTLNHTAEIDREAGTIVISVTLPPAFPRNQRTIVSNENLSVNLNISTAARITPQTGSAMLGIPADWSKPNTYTVSAANGTTKEWTITINPLPVISRYDAIYVMTGTMTDNVNSALTGFYPANVSLVTQSENSVAMFDLDYVKDFGHRILNGNANSHYGSFSPVFTFDSNHNVVSVTNYFGQPSSNGRAGELDPTGENKWDPETKTLKVKYWMLQNGTRRTHFDETFTWKE